MRITRSLLTLLVATGVALLAGFTPAEPRHAKLDNVNVAPAAVVR